MVVTESVELLVAVPDVAVIVAIPGATPVTDPAVTVATVGVEDCQVAVADRSAVLLSEKVPSAVNCRAIPTPVEKGLGVTRMDCNAAGLTLIPVDPETEPEEAVMVAEPAPTAVARPPPALIVATEGGFEAHEAVEVTSAVWPSVYVPLAPNCCVTPLAIVGFEGVIAIEAKTGGGECPPPQLTIDAASNDTSRSANGEPVIRVGTLRS